MLAFIGKLFGSAKAGEAIIDGVSNGIDKMWHTAEKKQMLVLKLKVKE